MRKLTFAARYATIATAASLLNLAIQWLFMQAYSGPFAVEASIMVATAAVLPVKYVVEKALIFDFKPQSISHDARTFVAYTAMSVAPVLLFWAVEYGAHLIFKVDALRYVAGAIGLALSFWLKYVLDRRFVFGKA